MANEIPNPLPSVLPAGTRALTGDDLAGYVLTTYNGRPAYKNDARCHTATLEWIDWATMPLPAPPAPPPDVAAPGDRLFGCGLSFSGVERKFSDVADDRCPGHSACKPCSVKWRGAAIDEIRRRALQTPPAPEKWEPAVGQWCEGESTACSRVGPGKKVRGMFCNLTREGNAVLECPDEARHIDGHHKVMVTRASLRPATPSQPAAATKGEGARKAAANSCMVCFAAISSGYQVCAYCSHVKVEQSDGDRNVTRIKNRERRDDRIAALSIGDELSQLAARRQRQRGALLEAMDDGKARREAVRGKHDWDPEDAQPLTVS